MEDGRTGTAEKGGTACGEERQRHVLEVGGGRKSVFTPGAYCGT